MISTEKVEQFMEVARQLEYEESRNDREGSRESDRDEDRERLRKGSSFERERKSESNRYAPYPSSRSERDRAKKSRKENRVYVSNLPFSLKWQELKDHMKKAGDVLFAEILEDSTGRSKGCGVVEYATEEDAQRAIRELADTDCGGRLLKIREDRVESDDRPRRSREKSSGSSNASSVSTNILSSLGGLGMMGLGQFGLLQQMSAKSDPLASTVFVSNLDYRVTWAKLKDTFKQAGRVVRADISEGSDGKSRGHGTVQFETPLEAVNAVFVMNNKSLYDRTMHVRLDRESPYFNMFGGQTGSSVTAASNLANSFAGMATGMAGMNPLAMLQLQSMASLGGMTGLTGLAGFGGMNYGAAATGVAQQSAGMQAADTSALTTAMNSAATNPYAAMLAASQGLASQNYASQLYGGQSLMSSMQPTAKADLTKQVFVRNLPWKVTWQELKDKFREAGRVARADVLMDDKQRSKGCGTVLFESSEEAARAITLLNGTVMDGRQIEVRMDRG